MPQYCPFRNKSIPDSPEEIVRQCLLAKMTQELGYPKECLVLEREISGLPHLQGAPLKIPQRRVDILCFAKSQQAEANLFPLLLIECKAVPLQSYMLKQLIGYNYYIQACFVALVNGQECRLGWQDSRNEYQFQSVLPSYADLLASLKPT